MPIYSSSSDSDDNVTTRPSKPTAGQPRPLPRLFRRQRPLHDLLGGGKVADVLLWKNKTVSAALLMGMTVIWFLFEVVEYNVVTLLCHISITAMLVIFIWSTAADLFDWNRPKIPQVALGESTLREVAWTFQRRSNEILSKLLDVACGKDPGLFVLAMVSLYVLSVIGTYFSFLNLLYLGFVCMQTLPFMYDRYEDQIDYVGDKEIRRLKKMFKRFNSYVLNKIPRGPAKDH